jgi:hypothetical protein
MATGRVRRMPRLALGMKCGKEVGEVLVECMDGVLDGGLR